MNRYEITSLHGDDGQWAPPEKRTVVDAETAFAAREVACLHFQKDRTAVIVRQMAANEVEGVGTVVLLPRPAKATLSLRQQLRAVLTATPLATGEDARLREELARLLAEEKKP